MNESRIIKSIKYHAIRHLLDGEYWHIDRLFAYAAAIIYPFISQVEFDDQSGSIKQLVKELTKFLRTQKSDNLDILSFEGMVSFFVDKLCPNVTYATKKECLSESITLISSISEDGYISWKGKTEVYNSIVKTYEKDAYLYEYGRESYNVISIAENKPNSNKLPLSDKIINTPKVKKERKQVPIPSIINEAEEELTKYWEKEIIQKSPDFMKAMPYVWKLALPHSTYCDLKSKLQNCLSNLQGRARTAFVKKHSLKLFIYIAEWYKWEYTNRNENALDECCIEGNTITQIVSKLWENHPNWKKDFLYAQQNQRWIDSIYILGGFPLNQIYNDNRFDGIFEIIAKEEWENDIENIISIYRGVHDTIAATQSLDRRNGGLRKYIETLTQNYTNLYAEEDVSDNELVRHLFDRLIEGRRESIEKSIKYHWIFYTSPDSEKITADIIINIGADGSKGCVATEILNAKESQIYVGIEAQNEIIKYRKYSRTLDGEKYVGWGTISNRIRGYIEDLSQPISLCKYNTNILSVGKGEEIKQFEIGNEYIVVYAMNDDSGWTTLNEYKNNKNNKAVFFPNEHYEIVSSDRPTIQSKYIGGKLWTLCEVGNAITLKSKNSNKEYTTYCDEKLIFNNPIKLDTIRYPKKCNDKSLVRCSVNDQEEYLPLMIGVPNDKVIILRNKEDNGKGEVIKLKGCSLANYTHNGKIDSLQKNPPKKPCIIKLDLEATNSNGQIFKNSYRFFYLPANSISRDVNNSKVCFDNLSGTTICRVLPNDEEEKLESNYYKDDSRKYQKDETLRFRIYSSKCDYVELDIYRPIYSRELSFDGSLIEQYSSEQNQTIMLPYILRDKFHLRIYDKDGVKYPTHFRNMHWFSLGRPQNAIQQCDEFSIYLYANRQVEGKEIGVLDIGTKRVDQYKFYYWKVDNRTEPQLIDVLYDDNKKVLIVPQDRLREGGIIFQSLKDCLPIHYVPPFYSEENWTTLVNRMYGDGLISKCYKIAIEHKVPFTQFYPLHNIVKRIENLKKLLDSAINDKSIKDDIKFAELHRFANEFNFEWILLPRSFWREFVSKDKELVCKFLRSSNFISTIETKNVFGQFLSNYLDFENKTAQKRFQTLQCRGEIAIVLSYMKGANKIIPIKQQNIVVLENLYQNDKSIIENLLRRIQEI